MFIALSVVLVVILIGVVVVLWTSLERLESVQDMGSRLGEEVEYEDVLEALPVEQHEEQEPPAVTAEVQERWEPGKAGAGPTDEVAVEGEVEEITEEELKTLAEEAPVEHEIVEEPAEAASAEPEIVEEEEPLPPEKESLDHLLPDLGGYEFKDLPIEGEENFLLPKWMYQFFSAGEAYHTLSEDGSVVLFIKVLEAEIMLQGSASFQIGSDTGASEIVLAVSFEDGSARETTRFIFDLSDDAGRWSAIKLVDQSDIRLDVLTRDEEGRLEYKGTRHFSLPPDIESGLRATIKELSSRER